MSGTLVRYADDVVAICQSEREARRKPWRQLTGFLCELGLAPKAEKTRIVHLEVGGDPGIRLSWLPASPGAGKRSDRRSRGKSSS